MEFHKYANLFPMMQIEEYQKLIADVKENGLVEKIILHEGKILDGRNRFMACGEAGIQPEFETYAGKEPLKFVISKNMHRRHLSASQKAIIAVDLLPMLEDEAETRKLATLKQFTEVEILPHRYEEGKSRDFAGEMLGVSGRYVSDAKAIIDKMPDLKEKIASGEMSLQDAKKEVRQAELTSERKELADKAQAVPDNDRVKLWQGDITKDEPKEQYDFIITDPPYLREYLPLYDALASYADKALKDGGLLIAMCGQSYVDYIYNALAEKLTYYWTACYLTPGQPTPLRQRQVNTTWKPLLIFAKGDYHGKIFGDVFRSDENDKNFHHWGQSVSGMLSIIKGICLPGQSILDPFLGGGTTGVAAIQHGCYFDGFDLDAENVNISKSRIYDQTGK